MSAAVADYTSEHPSDRKIKKENKAFEISLTPTRDILADMGKQKNGRFLAGFALETDHEAEQARSKLRKKNLDMIVLNSLNDPGAGFGHDTNKITIFDREGTETPYDLMSKEETAKIIVQYILRKLK
jgi:phosphopantothenoylcysteine decarboxylase/phosphopantothenate--cysteine ligase